jgi:hypothetical protein
MYVCLYAGLSIEPTYAVATGRWYTVLYHHICVNDLWSEFPIEIQNPYVNARCTVFQKMLKYFIFYIKYVYGGNLWLGFIPYLLKEQQVRQHKGLFLTGFYSSFVQGTASEATQVIISGRVSFNIYLRNSK